MVPTNAGLETAFVRGRRVVDELDQSRCRVHLVVSGGVDAVMEKTLFRIAFRAPYPTMIPRSSLSRTIFS